MAEGKVGVIEEKQNYKWILKSKLDSLEVIFKMKNPNWVPWKVVLKTPRPE